MTPPNPPPEDPEYTSELNTLSPVSPKPLHYPAPQNIPILEKQIDQAFNQTSAHMAQAGIQQTLDQAIQGGAAHQPSFTVAGQSASTQQQVDLQQSHPVELGGDAQGRVQGAETDSQMNYAHTDTAPAQAGVASASAPSEESPAQASIEPVPSPSESEHQPNAPSQSNANVPAQSLAAAQSNNDEAQSRGVTVEPSALSPPSSSAPGVDNNANGVQFQASLQDMLANLSQASNAAIANVSHMEGVNQSTTAGSESRGAALQGAPGTGDSSHTAAAASLSGPPPGLPPKPPAQEQPAIHPSYNSTTDIRAFHPHSQHSAAAAAAAANVQTNGQQIAAYPASAQLPAFAPAPGQSAAPSANGLPPPPLASFQQQTAQPLMPNYSQSPTSQANRQRELESQRQIKEAAGEVLDDADVPWTPETQRKYDVFLNEERKYVTEGNWEQFPQGSRLFVGNLSSERVTKRDIFHVFHRYGDLAQISIKQAYGFVQYLQTDACARAMQVEQGKTIRGKKIHLEVSKPQKNRNDAKGNRRSRSPDHRLRGSPASDRYPERRNDGRNNSNSNNNNTNGRRGGGGRGGPGRDDQYRPSGRSPSPPGRYRNNRDRDRSRDRYDGRYRSRSRSPYGAGRTNGGSRYRSPTPTRKSSADDDDLPLPRRHPSQVPDVQIIVLDAPSRDFIAYIESVFVARSLRVDVLFLSPRLSLDAVLNRQALEGVTAVSQLTRLNQQAVKIPLRIFDRGRGSGDVRFDNYIDLDPTVAAELVLRAKTTAAQAPAYPAVPPIQYGYGGGFSQSQPPMALSMPPAPPVTLPGAHGQSNLTNLITSLDPMGLQKLLGAMQQPGAAHGLPPLPPPPPQSTTALTPDLARLLGGSAAVNPPPPPHQSHPSHNSLPPMQQNLMPFAQNWAQGGAVGGYGGQQQASVDSLAALRANPALAGLLSPTLQMHPQGLQHGQGHVHQQQQQQQQPPSQGPQHDMAEILARLGTYGQR